MIIESTKLGCHVRQLYGFNHGCGKYATSRKEIKACIGMFKGIVLASVVTKVAENEYDSQSGSYKNLLACGFRRAGKAFRNPSTDNKVVLLYKITAR